MYDHKKNDPVIKEVKIGDLQIHTEFFGNINNPACLLISGAMASSRFWSDSFCNLLVQAGYFVIRYDHRDIGLSSGVDWRKNPYKLNDLANDVIKILDNYNIDKANFIGHSMGGYICQQLALDFPQRTNSIIIISAGPLGATIETEKALTLDEQKILNKTWSIFLSRKDSENLEETIESFMPVWKYLNGSIKFDENLARSYTADLLKRTKHEIKAGNNHELMMKNLHETMGERKNITHNIMVPTLIIYGAEDPLVLPREMKGISHSIKNSELVVIPGMGHVFFNRDTESKIAKIIVTYLNKLLKLP